MKIRALDILAVGGVLVGIALILGFGLLSIQNGRYVTDVLETNSYFDVANFKRECLSRSNTVLRHEEGNIPGGYKFRMACMVDRNLERE